MTKPMRVGDVEPGQRFMLLRNARPHTCYGPHPKSPYHILTEPNKGQWPLKSLHMNCHVTLLQEESAGGGRMKSTCPGCTRRLPIHNGIHMGELEMIPCAAYATFELEPKTADSFRKPGRNPAPFTFDGGAV